MQFEYKRLQDFLRNIYRRLIPTLKSHLMAELVTSSSVLDLGCGKKSIIAYCNVEWSVGVDLFSNYLKESKTRQIHSDYIRADVEFLPLKEKSFDVVIAIDLLEHISKGRGYKLLERMEKLAKKKVIIFTPNGYLPQSIIEGNPWQYHKSGWILEEFEKRGFKIYGINGLRIFRGSKAIIRYEPKRLWRLISDLSERMVHRNPKSAFQLFCVKILDLPLN